MLRKMMIALAATTFMGALAASTAADARMGGGGGFRGGGFHGAAIGGGFRGGMVGGGFRGAAFRGGVVGRRFSRRRFPRWSGGRRFPQCRFPRWFRRVTQLCVPAGICTTRQSVCVRPVQSVPQSPLCLRGGAIWRRRWSLWRLVLELATDPVGLAAGLDL